MTNNDSPESDKTVDEFVSRQSPEFRCATNELVDLIRQQLKDAEERVENDMAVFSRDGQVITGVGVSNGKCCLYVPQKEVAQTFAPSMGTVQQIGNQISFDKLSDVRRSELKRLIDEQNKTITD